MVKLQHNLVFNCGKCIACRKKKAQEIATRCVLHASLYIHNCFITLTYDEKKPEYHNKFQYEDIQKFKKRLRRYCEHHYDKKIQVFNVHEYGKNGKKHWHLVVFNHDFQDKTLYTKKNGNNLYTSKKLEELWPFGFSTIGHVTEASALYQAQYMQKDLKNGNLQNDKKSHSKHSGIGRDYFLAHYEQILRLGYIPFDGKKFPLPRYFQKLAHKHYSHFYEPKNFIDYPDRKKLYSTFKPGQAKKDVADLYKSYYAERQNKIEELTEQWYEDIQEYIYTKEKPDFAKTGANYLYDLGNRTNTNHF